MYRQVLAFLKFVALVSTGIQHLAFISDYLKLQLFFTFSWTHASEANAIFVKRSNRNPSS